MTTLKDTELTEAQEGALQIIREPAYTADGTRIDDRTGKALWRKGLVTWSDAQQRYSLTEKGLKAYESF